MGVAELRSTFNEAAPDFSCSQALLTYERNSDGEWQRLTFRGLDPDGAPFEAVSELLRPESDVIAAARAVAGALAARRVIPPEPQP